MEFKKEIIIEKPAGQVWEVLGNQYGEAYKWASGINHSNSYGQPELTQANCSVVGFTIRCGNRKSPLCYRWTAWTHVDNSSAISGVGNRRIRRTQAARLISIPSEFPCLG